jgi:hypothetical protein
MMKAVPDSIQSVTYDAGYGSKNQVRFTHTRQVLFVKPEYWIVADTFLPDDAAGIVMKSCSTWMPARPSPVRRDGTLTNNERTTA